MKDGENWLPGWCLSEEDKKYVLGAFTYRSVITNRLARNRHGVKFRDDNEWLIGTVFLCDKYGVLKRDHGMCTTIKPTWPLNPELRGRKFPFAE